MTKDEALDTLQEVSAILESLSKLLKQASSALEVDNIHQMCNIVEACQENDNVVSLNYEFIE